MEPVFACYISDNDIPGLSTESILIDGADEYVIVGEPIAIGRGGLSAFSEPSPKGPAIVAAPLILTESQTWSLEGRNSPTEEAGLSLAGNVSGSASTLLEVVLSNEPTLYFEEKNDTEVGPVTIRGADVNEPGVLNGAAILRGGKVNSSDGQPVKLTDGYLGGNGATGALTTSHSELNVGPEQGIEVSSATFDSMSKVTFHITREGTVAKRAYSQLVSPGAIELDGAELEVGVFRVSKGACPVLVPGSTYTLVSTTGKLSGSFANAPEGGPEIPIAAGNCPQRSQTMRIAYHEGGGRQTVTGTVEEAAFIRKQQEAAAKRQQEEEAAARRKQAEEAAAAKATTPSQQLPGNIGVGPPVPDARLASTTLDATASGAVKIRISCPALEIRCFGTVSLRTLNAVRAAARTHKRKAAVLTLATGSFSVAGGKVTTVVLHLSAKARALLGRAHTLKVRATIIARDPAGAKHTNQTVVTLRAPAAKRHKR